MHKIGARPLDQGQLHKQHQGTRHHEAKSGREQSHGHGHLRCHPGTLVVGQPIQGMVRLGQALRDK